MAKKDRGASVSLDSFLDILTCLQGVLMLVIISTGIDAAQTKVLIPTPMETYSTKRPVYVECRENLIYPVDVDGLWTASRDAIRSISKDAAGDQIKMLQAMSSAAGKVTNEYYEVDMSYALLGQLAIRPNTNSDTAGFALDERSTLSSDNFMIKLLKEVDIEKDKIMLIVRDDSYTVFKTAQRLSFLKGVEVSVEVFDSREPIRFSQMTAYR